jgi:hypothetical protein
MASGLSVLANTYVRPHTRPRRAEAQQGREELAPELLTLRSSYRSKAGADPHIMTAPDAVPDRPRQPATARRRPLRKGTAVELAAAREIRFLA